MKLSSGSQPASWLDIPEDSDFGMGNIPFGIFQTDRLSPRVGTRIGDRIIDLSVLAAGGYLTGISFDHKVLQNSFLNDFIRLGKGVTSGVRTRLIELFDAMSDPLQKDRPIHERLFLDHDHVTLLMPVSVGDYTDFYSSKEHATNVGSMFRDPANALLPNWRHMPVAYHGRASSIMITGTPVRRPQGQARDADEDVPHFGPTRALDFELEMAFVVGKDSIPGRPITTAEAEDYIFGLLLFNDWSARDIQRWEYVPLGPFLSKNFMSSVSAWVVTLEALDPFRTEGPTPEDELLPYLVSSGKRNYDIELEVNVQNESGDGKMVCHSNFKYMYWNICQQLAHHTINGCNVRVGDMMASGTISGPGPGSYGSLLEITRNGQHPFEMPDGTYRTFLNDGDHVVMSAFARNAKLRVGFGEVAGKVLPAS